MLWSLCIQVYEGPTLPRGPEQQHREETSVQLGVPVPLPGVKAQVWGRFQRGEPGWSVCQLPDEKILLEKKRCAAFAFASAFGGCEMLRSSPVNGSFPAYGFSSLTSVRSFSICATNGTAWPTVSPRPQCWQPGGGLVRTCCWGEPAALCPALTLQPA